MGMKRNTLRFMLITSLVGTVLACQRLAYTSEHTWQDSFEKQATLLPRPPLVQPGKSLMETQCYACHSPKQSREFQAGPVMAEIKTQYLAAYPKREDFIQAIVDFVNDPVASSAIIKDAATRFTPMPKSLYKESDLRAIAAYLFDYQVEIPAWYGAAYEQEFGKSYTQTGQALTASTTTKTQMELGQQYAMATKSVLGQTLLSQIKSKGTAGALEFCNTRAYPLTDSMSRAQGVQITRITDKARNPKNQANTEETALIAQFKKTLAEGGSLKPAQIGKSYYYPITTNSMCLQCHGAPQKDINAEVMQSIQKKYPSDKATGYLSDELRGLFRVTFKD
jgi:nitrate reductase cytochrome c-type subunit